MTAHASHHTQHLLFIYLAYRGLLINHSFCCGCCFWYLCMNACGASLGDSKSPFPRYPGGGSRGPHAMGEIPTKELRYPGGFSYLFVHSVKWCYPGTLCFQVHYRYWGGNCPILQMGVLGGTTTNTGFSTFLEVPLANKLRWL